MRIAGPLVLGLAALACSGERAIAPPELHPGVQSCEHCAMAVSDQRAAAAMILEAPDGGRRDLIFDDVGCLLAYTAAHPDARVVARYVRDYEAAGWIDADDAAFLRSPAIPTPMHYGIAAFASSAVAESARATRGGEVMDLAALLAEASSGGIRPRGVEP